MDTTRERLLRPSRRKLLALLTLSAGFTAAGVWMAADGQWFGWVGTAFFGLCVVVFVVQLLPNSAYLRLSPEGFEFRSLFRSHTCRWCDVDRFGVGNVGITKMVFINYAPNAPESARLRRLATALSGWEGALPDTYGLSAEDLVALLNAYKEAAGRA